MMEFGLVTNFLVFVDFFVASWWFIRRIFEVGKWGMDWRTFWRLLKVKLHISWNHRRFWWMSKHKTKSYHWSIGDWISCMIGWQDPCGAKNLQGENIISTKVTAIPTTKHKKMEKQYDTIFEDQADRPPCVQKFTTNLSSYYLKPRQMEVGDPGQDVG